MWSSRFGVEAGNEAALFGGGIMIGPIMGPVLLTGKQLEQTKFDAVFDGHADTVAHLRAGFAALGGPCAVRSSAIGEDGTAASFAAQCAGEAMNRFVRLIGRNESGSLVLISTVRSSIFRAPTKVGIRDAVTPTWLASSIG